MFVTIRDLPACHRIVSPGAVTDSLGFVGELGPVGDDPSDDGDTIDDESILHVSLGDSCNLASIVIGANHSNTTEVKHNAQSASSLAREVPSQVAAASERFSFYGQREGQS